METIGFLIRYLCLLVCVSVVKAATCYKYSSSYGLYYLMYCANSCCGSYSSSRYCCYYYYYYYYSYTSYYYYSATSSVGLIAGAVIGGIVGFIVLVVIIICIISACKSSGSKGTVVRPVNTNQHHTVAIVSSSNPQPVYGQPQPAQPPPYGQYQPHPQPQPPPPPAFGNPAYPPSNPPPYQAATLPNQPNVFENAAANAASSSKAT